MRAKLPDVRTIRSDLADIMLVNKSETLTMGLNARVMPGFHEFTYPGLDLPVPVAEFPPEPGALFLFSFNHQSAYSIRTSAVKDLPVVDHGGVPYYIIPKDRAKFYDTGPFIRRNFPELAVLSGI